MTKYLEAFERVACIIERAALIFLTTCSSSFGQLAFDHDVSQTLRHTLTEDLAFVGGIKGERASHLHKRVFGPLDGGAYLRFFGSRVTQVGVGACGESTVACFIRWPGDSKIWLSSTAYSKKSLPQVARVMLLFHEARHTEKTNNWWPHASCPSPFVDQNKEPIRSLLTGAPLAGEEACDHTPLGAYGISWIMLKNIARFCTNCDEKTTTDAEIYAEDQLRRIVGKKSKARLLHDMRRSK